MLEAHACMEHLTLPIVLIGYLMGGLYRRALRTALGDDLTAIILSAPVRGKGVRPRTSWRLMRSWTRRRPVDAEP